MINIGITTYNRVNFLKRCVKSVVENTIVPYNLFIYDDNSTDRTGRYLLDELREQENITVFTSNKRRGIVPGFNKLWDLSVQKAGHNKYFCYLQDDVVITEKGWLKKLIGCYEAKEQHPTTFGLFTGHHAPEHPTEGLEVINGEEVFVKKSMRATNMIAPYTFWDKIGRIPDKNPDGSVRGFPGPKNPDGSRGRGSSIDIYITGHQSKGVYVHGHAGPTNSWKLGTYCMVVPGLVKHEALSKEDSTWGNPNKED